MTYQPGGYTQPPFDSTTVRRGPSRKDTWVVIGTVAGVLVMLGLGTGAIYLITSKNPAQVGAGTQTTQPVDPLAVAAAQQFADAVTADDPKQAVPAICAAQKDGLRSEKPSGTSVQARVTDVKISANAGTFVLVETPKQGSAKQTDLTLVKENDEWKVCSG